jgi:hypothetical protein
MLPVDTQTSRVPRTDPHLSAAGDRVREAAAELKRLGIADHNGKRIRKDLPVDMREDAGRDFGGSFQRAERRSPLDPVPPKMFIVAGPPGSGKSTAFRVAGFGVDFSTPMTAPRK